VCGNTPEEKDRFTISVMGGASIVTHSFRIEVGNGSSGDDFYGEASKRAETSSTDTGRNDESGMTDFLISGTQPSATASRLVRISWILRRKKLLNCSTIAERQSCEGKRRPGLTRRNESTIRKRDFLPVDRIFDSRKEAFTSLIIVWRFSKV
jgi:hypothetical protein